jgi:hypothetical protein
MVFVLLIQVIFLLIYLYQLGYLDNKVYSTDDVFNLRMITTIVVVVFGIFQIIALAEYTESVYEYTIHEVRENGLPEKPQKNEPKNTNM